MPRNSRFTTLFHLTGDEGIEPPPKVLETPIIPLDQSPLSFTVLNIYITSGVYLSRKIEIFFILSFSYETALKNNLPVCPPLCPEALLTCLTCLSPHTSAHLHNVPLRNNLQVILLPSLP